jgi:hypothetical protein
VNDEVERVWKEAVGPYLRILSRHVTAGTEEVWVIFKTDFITH